MDSHFWYVCAFALVSLLASCVFISLSFVSLPFALFCFLFMFFMLVTFDCRFPRLFWIHLNKYEGVCTCVSARRVSELVALKGRVYLGLQCVIRI